MSTQTTELSALLLSVAGHLADHPELAPVNVIYPHHLQVRERTTDGAALLAWADTLAEPGVDVARIDERAFVHVHGHLDGHPVVIWHTVDGLAHAMGAEAFGGSTAPVWITVQDLRTYLTDGTAPVPGPRPEGVPELAGVVS